MSNKNKEKSKRKETASRPKSSVEEKIRELEDQIAKTKYNKKTQHAIGLYKAQLAKLKEKQEDFEGALEAYKKILDISPDHEEAGEAYLRLRIRASEQNEG